MKICITKSVTSYINRAYSDEGVDNLPFIQRVQREVLEEMRDTKFRKGAGSLEVQSEGWDGTEDEKTAVTEKGGKTAVTEKGVMSAWGVAMNVSAEDEEDEAKKEEEEEEDDDDDDDDGGGGGENGDGDMGDRDREDDKESHRLSKRQPGSCSLSKKP